MLSLRTLQNCTPKLARYSRTVFLPLRKYGKDVTSTSEPCKDGFIRNVTYAPRDPPDNYNPEEVESCFFKPPECVPAKIYRPLKSPDVVMGPGADEKGTYKNAMYFAYHRYSYYELQKSTLEMAAEKRKEAEECKENSECNKKKEEEPKKDD